MALILCIDDEVALRRDISMLLQGEGYDVIEARDGAEGLALIRQRRPDLVLSDITMPAMSGLQLLDAVKRLSLEFADMPFIFMSARTERDQIAEGYRIGVDNYLTKPIDFDVMLAMVRSQLDHARRIREKRDAELDELRRAVMETLPHEMRTPLTHVIGFGEFLQLQAAHEPSLAQHREHLDAMVHGGRRLHRLVEEMLDFVDVLAGRVEMTPRRCNVARMIEEVCNKLAADHEGLVIACDIPPELPPVTTDCAIVAHLLCAAADDIVRNEQQACSLRLDVPRSSWGRVTIRLQDEKAEPRRRTGVPPATANTRGLGRIGLADARVRALARRVGIDVRREAVAGKVSWTIWLDKGPEHPQMTGSDGHDQEAASNLSAQPQ